MIILMKNPIAQGWPRIREEARPGIEKCDFGRRQRSASIPNLPEEVVAKT